MLLYQGDLHLSIGTQYLKINLIATTDFPVNSNLQLRRLRAALARCFVGFISGFGSRCLNRLNCYLLQVVLYTLHSKISKESAHRREKISTVGLVGYLFGIFSFMHRKRKMAVSHGLHHCQRKRRLLLLWLPDHGFRADKRSAEKLKAVCEEKQIKQVITSHSGILSASSAFSHMNESPAWREKGFVFCRDADENPYSM